MSSVKKSTKKSSQSNTKFSNENFSSKLSNNSSKKSSKNDNVNNNNIANPSINKAKHETNEENEENEENLEESNKKNRRNGKNGKNRKNGGDGGDGGGEQPTQEEEIKINNINYGEYLELDYHITKKQIRVNTQKEDKNIVEQKSNYPTETRLVDIMKDLDKNIIPKCNIFLYEGKEIEKINRAELYKGRNKRKGFHNIGIKDNPNNMFLGMNRDVNREMKRMPQMLDSFIEERERKKMDKIKEQKNKKVDNYDFEKFKRVREKKIEKIKLIKIDSNNQRVNDDCLIF